MKKRFRLLVIAFSVSFAVMASLSFYSLNQFSALTGYSAQVDHTNEVITLLYKIESGIKDYDILEKSFMISRDSAYVRDLYSLSIEVNKDLAKLEDLLQANESQNQLTMLKSAVAMRVANAKDNINHIDTSTLNRISPYYAQGNKMKMEALQYIKKMLQKEKAALLERSEVKSYYQRTTSTTIIYLLSIFAIVTIVLFIIMIRELKYRIASQDELQLKLLDLKRSHSELEQIAFAASHDLQEPLRKIRIFSDRLQWLDKEKGNENSETVSRITTAAGRMQELIDDMVNLTSLIREEGEKEDVNLNSTLKNVLKELDEKISNKDAVIHHEVLPNLMGYPRQFHILFKSLLDNSLKFTHENVTPVISVRADKVTGQELAHINKDLSARHFQRITFTDNGIGFDNKFISKMFKIFQRLHNQESAYEGKGIGLAMCQRIMVNHEGYIIANGHAKTGATFKLFFPIPES